MKRGVAEKKHARSASLVGVKTGKTKQRQLWRKVKTLLGHNYHTSQDNHTIQNQIAYVELEQADRSQTPDEIQPLWTLCQSALKAVYVVLSINDNGAMFCFAAGTLLSNHRNTNIHARAHPDVGGF